MLVTLKNLMRQAAGGLRVNLKTLDEETIPMLYSLAHEKMQLMNNDIRLIGNLRSHHLHHV